MRLSPLFSDNMVLQRGKKNILWGSAFSGSDITGTFGDDCFRAKTSENGYFEVILPPRNAGGPYQLNISDGITEQIVENILVGDVFLLGGQSNMELPLSRTLDLFREELLEAKEPDIRLFEVPKNYSFGIVREELQGGSWIMADGLNLLQMSAVGYFFAKKLRENHPVPIGLIQTAVGGTPIKAWCREESLQKQNLFIREISLCKDASYVKDTMRQDTEREKRWHEEAKMGFDMPQGNWERIAIPGLFENTSLKEYHGSLVLRKKIVLTKEESNQSASLVLGAIVDADQVFINEILVGETGYRYPPRRYCVAPGILREGENEIRIEMLVFRGSGGFVPGKQYALEFEYGAKGTISLMGEWQYRKGRQMEELPDPTFFQYMAAGMYNGMLYPLRRLTFLAFLYYQGESDTHHTKGYCKAMCTMIQDWRLLFGDENLPFLYVQLPGFADTLLPCATDCWAKLREEQRHVLAKTNQTGMVVLSDIGEYNDLHPQDKKTVGYRLSLAVRKLVYGEKIPAYGPLYNRMEVVNHSVLIFFTETAGGLMNREEGRKELSGFEICGKDEAYMTAKALIQGDSVLVWAEEISNPCGVRYGWSDYPVEAGLKNTAGLPASPFWAVLEEK